MQRNLIQKLGCNSVLWHLGRARWRMRLWIKGPTSKCVTLPIKEKKYVTIFVSTNYGIMMSLQIYHCWSYTSLFVSTLIPQMAYWVLSIFQLNRITGFILVLPFYIFWWLLVPNIKSVGWIISNEACWLDHEYKICYIHYRSA